MNSDNRADFDEQMALLCAGYNVPLSVRPDAYWKSMQKMSIVEFARCVEFALSEEGPEKIPTTHDLWNIRQQLKRRPQVAAAKAAKVPDPEPTPGLIAVNRLFLRYLAQRRLTEGSKADIDVPARRAACLDLARWFDEMAADDMRPDPDELLGMFATAMAKILDRAGAEAPEAIF